MARDRDCGGFYPKRRHVSAGTFEKTLAAVFEKALIESAPAASRTVQSDPLQLVDKEARNAQAIAILYAALPRIACTDRKLRGRFVALPPCMREEVLGRALDDLLTPADSSDSMSTRWAHSVMVPDDPNGLLFDLHAWKLACRAIDTAIHAVIREAQRSEEYSDDGRTYDAHEGTQFFQEVCAFSPSAEDATSEEEQKRGEGVLQAALDAECPLTEEGRQELIDSCPQIADLLDRGVSLDEAAQLVLAIIAAGESDLRHQSVTSASGIERLTGIDRHQVAAILTRLSQSPEAREYFKQTALEGQLDAQLSRRTRTRRRKSSRPTARRPTKRYGAVKRAA